MRIEALSLEDAFLVECVRLQDERGYFMRTYCEQEFAKFGLETRFVQTSISFNENRGTLRGMHYQAEPESEIKLVRCSAGAVFDVIVDLRLGSSTYGEWLGFELSEANCRQLYIPQGFAHGFQALSNAAVVDYQISRPYVPELARGIRWDDTHLNIRWPIQPPGNISERDRNLPLWADWQENNRNEMRGDQRSTTK